MPTVRTNDEGIEETFYTPEEFAAKDAEIARLAAENEKASKLLEDKNKNIEGFNKKMEVFDEVKKEVDTLKTQLTEKETKEREMYKTNSLGKLHGNREDLKAVLEEKYKILSGMPETTPDEIAARATEAAKLAGIYTQSQNPLYSAIDGEAPRYRENTDKSDEFLKSQKGQAALKAMGIEDAPKQ